MTEPFRLRLPRESDRVPVVYDSPHSGRVYPPDFETRLSRAELRLAEDAYVDELLDGALAYGVAVLDAAYPRSYIDLDRAPTDLAIDAPRLAPSEVQRRIDTVFTPYQHALDEIIESTRAKYGTVWHIDWHSMWSQGNTLTPNGGVAPLVDAVVSDGDGTTASPDVTRFIAYTLRGLGMRVAVNDPYEGGNIVRRVGAPSRHVHSVQVELNRALYLDEASLTKTTGFVALGRLLEVATREIGVVAAMQAR